MTALQLQRNELDESIRRTDLQDRTKRAEIASKERIADLDRRSREEVAHHDRRAKLGAAAISSVGSIISKPVDNITKSLRLFI